MSPTPIVYLAHPIDFAQAGRDTLQLIGSGMTRANLTAYIPGYAFKVPLGQPPNEKLSRINRAALTEADALIAFLPRLGETSMGVPMEIETARAQGKPTWIIGDFEVWGNSWALPRNELTFYSPDFTAAGVSNLRGLIGRHRRLSQQASTQPMYVKLDPGAALPTRAYEGDAGFDLYTTEEMTIQPGEFVDVPVGCSVQFPDQVWGMITGRSSTVRKLDLLVTVGIIDTGYRGPLYAGVRSLRTDPYVIKRGERIAQLIPFPNVAMGLHATPVDALTSSDRNEAGFGSSGA